MLCGDPWAQVQADRVMARDLLLLAKSLKIELLNRARKEPGILRGLVAKALQKVLNSCIAHT